MRSRPLLLVVLLALFAAVLGSCGGASAGEAEAPGRVPVVATTTQTADLVRNVGGDRVEVKGMLGPNTDPHDYEPRPSDAEAVSGARAIFRSGGDLDEWLSEVTESAGGQAPVVDLIDRVETIEGGHGHEQEGAHGAREAHAGEDAHAERKEHGAEEDPHVEEEKAHADDEEHSEGEDSHAGVGAGDVDPHWWHDPRNAERAVEAIRATLVGVDPAGREAYERNARAYGERLRSLDEQVASCLERVPAERRKLVTTHDALGYFADRYGIEVIGSVLDSLSTEVQASAGDTRELIEQVRDENVRAIFAESSVDSRLEETIARETGARVGPPLYADTLGPEGSPRATYVGSVAANADAMARGFTGGGGCSIDAAAG